MDMKAIEKNWAELKGKIKIKWGKFNDEEVESFRGDLSQLSGKIQKSYGIAKEHADRQFEDFKKSVHSLIGQDSGQGAGIEAPKAAVLPNPLAQATFTKIN